MTKIGSRPSQVRCSLLFPSQYFVSVSSCSDPENCSTALKYQPLAVSAYSFGRLIAAPLFGYLIDRFPIKWVVLITLGVAIVGHTLYVFCGNIVNPIDACCALIAARSIVGLGTGTVP